LSIISIFSYPQSVQPEDNYGAFSGDNNSNQLLIAKISLKIGYGMA
jgi:hypothetical protein